MKYKAHYKDKDALKVLSDGFTFLLSERHPHGFDKNEIVFACIGTDRCIGDAVGPLVGTYLQELGYTVVGTIQEPMHALNIDKRLKELRENYPKHTVIGIDACLGDSYSIGEIQIRDYPIHPGKGVGKNLPDIGHMSIIGIVDSSDSSELFTNRNIRLDLIMKISKVICDTIHTSFNLNKKDEPEKKIEETTEVVVEEGTC
ncbi:MAG TPA: spore protease YyaC [Pseudoneobacillus sp.]|nr:spore protease YyaC [Pseudoneobacillus sp.]